MFFRDAGQLQEERTASGIRKLQARYDANFDKWYDGTPDSIDRRLAQCDQLLQRYSAAVATAVNWPDLNRDKLATVLAGVEELREDKRCLEGLRQDILSAGADRDA